MSSGFLLDTNVASEQIQSRPEPSVNGWLRAQPAETLYLSVVTLGELHKGIALLPLGKRRSVLEEWLRDDLLPVFAGRVLPVTQAIASRWGVLTADRQRVGRPLGAADGLIAATAFEYNLILATRNTRDFDGLELSLLNPWELRV